MKRLLFIISLTFLAAPCALNAVDKPRGYVTDQAGILSPQETADLEAGLTELDRRTSIEMAVVTVKSLDGNDIADYANKLFRSYGIGKKGKDNGILFLIAPNERKMRIEVGYGLEGQLTDAGAGRILDEAVAPWFKQGQMAQGIFSGVAALSEKLTGQPLSFGTGYRARPPVGAQRKPTIGEKLLFLIFWVIVIFVVIKNPWLLLLFLSRGGSGGGWSGGGFGGGGFGGFGGGSSGGGGSSRGW